MSPKKTYIYVITGLLILIIGIFIVSAFVDKTKAWHSANNILVTINGYIMTLQEAIDNNVFIDGATQSHTTEIPDPGHGADSIWVSVDGDERTLQNAISTIGLCGSSSHSYVGGINLGHFASEIEVNGGDSFQELIDSGEFCCVSHSYSQCYDNDIYWYDSCDIREDKKQECGVSECGDTSLCWYCDSGARIKTRTCYDRGCSGGSCYETERIEEVARETCPNFCSTAKGFPTTYPWCYDATCH